MLFSSHCFILLLLSTSYCVVSALDKPKFYTWLSWVLGFVFWSWLCITWARDPQPLIWLPQSIVRNYIFIAKADRCNFSHEIASLGLISINRMNWSVLNCVCIMKDLILFLATAATVLQQSAAEVSILTHVQQNITVATSTISYTAIPKMNILLKF